VVCLLEQLGWRCVATPDQRFVSEQTPCRQIDDGLEHHAQVFWLNNLLDRKKRVASRGRDGTVGVVGFSQAGGRRRSAGSVSELVGRWLGA
jgi:hypothetical protein